MPAQPPHDGRRPLALDIAAGDAQVTGLRLEGHRLVLTLEADLDDKAWRALAIVMNPDAAAAPASVPTTAAAPLAGNVLADAADETAYAPVTPARAGEPVADFDFGVVIPRPPLYTPASADVRPLPIYAPSTGELPPPVFQYATPAPAAEAPIARTVAPSTEFAPPPVEWVGLEVDGSSTLPPDVPFVPKNAAPPVPAAAPSEHDTVAYTTPTAAEAVRPPVVSHPTAPDASDAPKTDEAPLKSASNPPPAPPPAPAAANPSAVDKPAETVSAPSSETGAHDPNAMIRYTCPRCRNQGVLAADHVGNVVRCSDCGKAMRLVMK